MRDRTNGVCPRLGAFVSRACVATILTLTGSGCAALGYSDRVLWRLASPTADLFAVCQEIPMFDGPGYDVRLERADGTVVRPLYQIGDGDPCTEMAWSPDGRTLVVLSGHVARLRFVDVAWALAHPSTTLSYATWRQIEFSSEGYHTDGRHLRFSTAAEVVLDTCPYDLAATKRTGTRNCLGPATTRHVAVPAFDVARDP